MTLNVKNAAFIRSLDPVKYGDLGPKLYEALQSIAQAHNNVAAQVNGNSNGEPAPPVPIDSVNVTGQNGHFDIAIQHNGDFSRGVKYYAEYDSTPHFSNPRKIDMGDVRNHSVFLGNQTLYWRAYAAYQTSGPSAAAYHGGSSSNPQPVTSGGGVGPPNSQFDQGSGTGTAGVGLSGPGPVPFRSSDGIPPIQNSTRKGV